MQNKPNFQKDQMNVSRVSTRYYDKWTPGEREKNKPNSNPIQTQSNPIKANIMPKQTQFKPKQTQFYNPPYPQRHATAGKELPAENQLPDGSRFSMLKSRLLASRIKKEASKGAVQ